MKRLRSTHQKNSAKLESLGLLNVPRYLKHAGPGLRDGRICVLMLRIGYSGASSSNKLTRRVLGKNRKPMDQAPNHRSKHPAAVALVTKGP